MYITEVESNSHLGVGLTKGEAQRNERRRSRVGNAPLGKARALRESVNLNRWVQKSAVSATNKEVCAMRSKRIAALLAALMITSSSALAEISVLVESKTVPPGARSVEVGVYLSNDTDLKGINFPLEIRSVNPGSFMAAGFDLSFGGRLNGGSPTYKRQKSAPSSNT